jgi:AraC-like DNA-binding protein
VLGPDAYGSGMTSHSVGRAPEWPPQIGARRVRAPLVICYRVSRDTSRHRQCSQRAHSSRLPRLRRWICPHAYASRPLSAPKPVGKSRFRPVLNHIEDALGNDLRRSDLASLMGLSISQLSHAFTAAYGVASHHYILQRRIDKAKGLSRNSNATVTVSSARVRLRGTVCR